MNMDNLTAQEAVFVLEYLATAGHGTKSALAAGYAEHSAHAQASILLKRQRIKDAIGDAIQARADALTLDAQWVLDELQGLYDSDIGEFIVIDPDTGEPKYNFRDVTREQLKKLDSIEITPTKFGTKISVKLANKLKTLETIGKHVSVEAFKEHLEMTAAVELHFDKDDENA